jgi:hypothetical protein
LINASAGKTAMTAFGFLALTSPVASAAAGAVSRFAGSATI